MATLLFFLVKMFVKKFFFLGWLLISGCNNNGATLLLDDVITDLGLGLDFTPNFADSSSISGWDEDDDSIPTLFFF